MTELLLWLWKFFLLLSQHATLSVGIAFSLFFLDSAACCVLI